ncbi:MAG: hypothetical protein U0M13_02460 [Desulfovibrio fairfieldensis]|nr:hypothetical protein [Desulfovibrio fairfieldensis]
MSNPIMAQAWADFILFAFKDDELVSQFNAETGRHYKQGRSPIEAAIDRVTGKDTDDAFAFSRWVTENFFGMEYAPDEFKAECARRDESAANGSVAPEAKA